MEKTGEKRAPRSLAASGARATEVASTSVTNKPTADNGRGAIPISERILVSEDEAAELLGLSKWTFRRFKDAGEITPVALPLGVKRNLYRLHDVRALEARS